MTSPADQPLSPRAVQNVARLRNLNVRIDPAATEPDWGDVGRVPREEYDVLRRLTPRMEGWFPRRPK